MTDIIQVLPDNIANQIAAGEVISRPASAVKELLENAVDAGATHIQLIVADAGKSLIQVIDNGKGMSATDARLCFERHATSKINKIDDLFHIKTMGFRGEALASIAAVAQVVLKTKRATDELGTYIEIENSVVKLQEPTAMEQGTSIAMKNLFFSVPARRNFLKSNASEMRHIIDEFIRVAMAFPQLFFSLTHNGQQVFHLEAGSLKQRIAQLLGNQYHAKLVAVNEHTDYMNISGFVGKPETAKKTRGDQYFFVNNRFIKSAYLNHAVVTAFDALLPKDSFPTYVLFMELDPAVVDVNVHPTKQEIKFEDEKLVYAFVQAAVKHALAQFSIAPSLDFSLSPEIQQLDAVAKPFTAREKQITSGGSLYQSFTQAHQAHKIDGAAKAELKSWPSFFTPPATDVLATTTTASTGFEFEAPVIAPFDVLPQAIYLQVRNTYVIVPIKEGVAIVHQQLAHERVLYEKYSAAIHEKALATQRSLFPETLHVNAQDANLLTELLPELHKIGYMIEPFGNQAFVIQGIPADVQSGNERHAIELLLEQFKHFSSDVKFSKREKLIRCMARQQAIKADQTLTQQEMEQLIQQLLACKTPNVTPTGAPTFTIFNEAYLDRLFGR